MAKALLKRPASELPEKEDFYLTDTGWRSFARGTWDVGKYGDEPEWWLENEEAEVFTREELVRESCYFIEWVRESGYMDGKDKNGFFWMNGQLERKSTKELYEQYITSSDRG